MEGDSVVEIMHVLFVSATIFMGDPITPVFSAAVTEQECTSKATSLQRQNPEKVYICVEESYSRKLIDGQGKNNE